MDYSDANIKKMINAITQNILAMTQITMVLGTVLLLNKVSTVYNNELSVL